MNRGEKEKLVEATRKRLERASALVLTDFSGLKVEQMNQLRAKLREEGLQYSVIKNTLLKLAAAGGPAESLMADLSGPNGVGFSFDDPVSLAKVLADFAKDNQKLELKAGLVEGRVVSQEDLKALAKLPGRQDLLAMLLSAMQGVPRSLVSVLAAVMRDLVGVLSAIADQKEAAG